MFKKYFIYMHFSRKVWKKTCDEKMLKIYIKWSIIRLSTIIIFHISDMLKFKFICTWILESCHPFLSLFEIFCMLYTVYTWSYYKGRHTYWPCDIICFHWVILFYMNDNRNYMEMFVCVCIYNTGVMDSQMQRN